MMAGEVLHEFDSDLSDYILAQFRAGLRVLPGPPRSIPELDYSQWHSLDLPVWLGRGVAALPATLSDHIWAGVHGDPPPRSLNDAELYSLETVADDPPMRCEEHAVWEPYPALHRRSVECVPEIREALTKQTAEEWAVDSAGFAARLSQEGLSLAEGVATVRLWLWRARRLLRLMNTPHVPQPPPGTHALPAHPNLVARRARSAESTAAPGRARPQVLTKETPPEPSETSVCGWWEAMAVTGLKKTKLYDLFRRGVLKGYRDGAMIRFYRAGLVAYMRERENGTAPQPRPVRRPRKARTTTPSSARFKFL
jgi:hypothetical protein